MIMGMEFNFDVNIEKRMPDTGKVFFVDRMTSDYAQAHPFDLDAFIEDVYQRYEQIALEDSHARTMCWKKSREELRKMWTAVLSDTNPRGDASLYPNQDGPQPALMEIWHKAGDYWRRGFRDGDLLPAIIPGHKITRLGEGEWIALFPKDMHLLNEELRMKNEESEESHEIVAAEEITTNCTNDANIQEQDSVGQNDAPEYSEPAKSEPTVAPRELDLFAQMQMQIDQLRVQNEELRMKNEEFCNMTQEQVAVCSPEPAPSPKPWRAVRAQKPTTSPYERLYGSTAIAAGQTNGHSDRNRKILAAVVTAAVFIVLVNTVGLMGIAAIGLLAGGLVK